MTLAICIGAVVVTLGLGGALTTIGPWYFSLDTPPWKPPNWAFGPVWASIGACAAAAADLAWHAAATPEQHQLIGTLFAVNAIFNILWSLLFFKLRRPDWALVEVLLLWLSVLALVVGLWPIRPLAAALIVPYLVWVSIAAALNRAIVRRNAPFGAAYRPKTSAASPRPALGS